MLTYVEGGNVPDDGPARAPATDNNSRERSLPSFSLDEYLSSTCNCYPSWAGGRESGPRRGRRAVGHSG